MLRARLGESLRRRQSGRFSTALENDGSAWETREIAMSRTTKLLGTVSVLATLAASPAAADQLAGFAGFADLAYSNISLDDDSSSDDSLNNITVGAGIAFPVAEVPALAWQLDGNYSSQSGDDYSRIVWN